jgi:CRP-like cAMP-binding protein
VIFQRNRMKDNKGINKLANIPKKLEGLGRLKQFHQGEMLFHAEDEADGFYYVRSGEIRVYKMDEQGKEVELVRLGPGEFLGEAIVFVSSVFPAFAQAIKDASVLFFEKSAVTKEMEIDPEISRFFVDLLARKCVVLSTKIESLGLRTVRQRLIQYLLSNCSGDQRCRVDLKRRAGQDFRDHQRDAIPQPETDAGRRPDRGEKKIDLYQRLSCPKIRTHELIFFLF